MGAPPAAAAAASAAAASADCESCPSPGGGASPEMARVKPAAAADSARGAAAGAGPSPQLPARRSRRKRALWALALAALSPVLLILARLLFVLGSLVYCGVVLAPARLQFMPAAAAAAVRPPANASAAATSAQWPVPRIIHQTWKDREVPLKWQEPYDSCQALHPDWTHMFWTDASARAFIAERYPASLASYDAYPFPIQRVDAIRYHLLHHYGGVYFDLDVGCARRLDPLTAFPLLLPVTDPVGFSNDVMVSAPGHPLMRAVVDALPAWNVRFGTRYPTVMFSTGPMFLTMQFAAFAGDRSALWALPGALYTGPAAFFHHYSGSSWHGADSRAIFLVYTHWRAVASAAAALVCCCGGLAGLRARRRRRLGLAGSAAKRHAS